VHAMRHLARVPRAGTLGSFEDTDMCNMQHVIRNLEREQSRLKECSFKGCRIVIRSEYNTNYLESRIDASWVKIRYKLVEVEDTTSTGTSPRLSTTI
jgi:hypothetical protein